MAIDVPWSVLPEYHCFGCSPHNPSGLGLTFTPHEDGVEARFELGRAFESYPGVVHGGLVGVICDETMGNLIVLARQVPAFTVSLRTRYVAPLLVGRPYRCLARLRDEEPGPLIHAYADVVDADGAVRATATATYQSFDLAELALPEDEIALLSTRLATPNGA
ncbi:acyl-coenzyme A thioesterase PaaI-like protein [Thermocatellispora tengchongensis]|uniref:Acyl-coenzyme A thioesterase PaaI-like protein n=1 Tax=Thermocatellispora tengchongensis TaxID=1073253 RepID=A0A840PQ44_9ACTN|nr:PaaI family thioesterase [Thermocatellispora tengchongensis]MBB5139197.1 acyl-coenzyme A thioesterase PaaI-like protein [Thermocatellispora tengchongensis]